MHFDPKLEIIVPSDSSNYGIGSVISHILPDGLEGPVAFTARTLTKCVQSNVKGIISHCVRCNFITLVTCEVTDEEGGISFFLSTYKLPITSKEIALTTRYNPILYKVLDFTINGWLHFTSLYPQVKQYTNKSTELSVEQGWLLWGSRVVVPHTHRKEIVIAAIAKLFPYPNGTMADLVYQGSGRGTANLILS